MWELYMGYFIFDRVDRAIIVAFDREEERR